MTRHIAVLFVAMVAFAAVGADVADESYASEAELPRLDALAFESDGSMIYGQVLVPSDPLDAFWAELGDGGARFRRTYGTGHSLMGARLTLAKDLKAFILSPMP